ncbi:MAG: hypothetical protein KAS66_09795 [Candidatus Omnitrophica bacterium]|nr:hypothetical protein [Candidatus Omnitrophota bacterium]
MNKKLEIKKGYLFISYPCVMKSAAGWYIGTYCQEYMGRGKVSDENEWCLQPYDRESGYHSNKEEVEKELIFLKNCIQESVETESEYYARFILFLKKFK